MSRIDTTLSQLQAQGRKRIGQLPGAARHIGVGVAVQWAVGLARNNVLLTVLGSAVFEHGRNQQRAVHHQAGLQGHGVVS